MRAADDFDDISRRMLDLRSQCKIDPARCIRHSFDPVSNRCIYCNLHYYHLPAVQNCGQVDANPGRASNHSCTDRGQA
jgi:hypothetical protein